MKKKLICHLKQYRAVSGISQQNLAEQIGIRRETIIRLEKGEYNPSLELAMDLANFFHTNVESLFEFTQL